MCHCSGNSETRPGARNAARATSARESHHPATRAPLPSIHDDALHCHQRWGALSSEDVDALVEPDAPQGAYQKDAGCQSRAVAPNTGTMARSGSAEPASSTTTSGSSSSIPASRPQRRRPRAIVALSRGRPCVRTGTHAVRAGYHARGTVHLVKSASIHMMLPPSGMSISSKAALILPLPETGEFRQAAAFTQSLARHRVPGRDPRRDHPRPRAPRRCAATHRRCRSRAVPRPACWSGS